MLPFLVLILVEVFFLLLLFCNVFQLQLQYLCNICTHETCLGAGRLLCADRLWPAVQQLSLPLSTQSWSFGVCVGFAFVQSSPKIISLCLYVSVIITLTCTDFLHYQKATFTRKSQSSSLLPGLYPPRSIALLCCIVILNMLRWVVDGEIKTTNQSVCFILLLITLYEVCSKRIRLFCIKHTTQRILQVLFNLLQSISLGGTHTFPSASATS